MYGDSGLCEEGKSRVKVRNAVVFPASVLSQKFVEQALGSRSFSSDIKGRKTKGLQSLERHDFRMELASQDTRKVAVAVAIVMTTASKK